MSAVPSPTLRLRIDRAALAANWRALDALTGPARTGAAVKARAYGLGVGACVPALREAGCRDWFVAHWQEVPEVLEHVPADEIAVLHGPMTAADARFARAAGVRPVIVSCAQARRWVEAGGGPCDLMVDTGINRLGVAVDDLGEPVVQALDIVTLHSHLASADEDSAQNAQQHARFAAARERVPHRRAALANSAGIALGPAYHADLTRPGLALYGGVPRADYPAAIRPVARPEAALIQTRTLRPGDRVGYNGVFVADRPLPTGIVSLGYADGILRAWGGGAFEAAGRRLPILGKVSMDMIVVDLSAAPDLREGDWVSLPYDLPAAAVATGLTQYELLTLLGQRFSRNF